MDAQFLQEYRKRPNRIEDMQDRAYDILDKLGMREIAFGGTKIVRILGGFGIKTYLSVIKPPELSAYIAIDPTLEAKFGTNRVACINERYSDGHKRFAIAHELAHYLFDYNEDVSPVYYDTYTADQKEPTEEKELRANRFAACILMPEDIFVEKYEQGKASKLRPNMVGYLSTYFRVSRRAIERRFQELGINE